MPERVTQHVVVPVADIDRVTFHALAYARSVDPAAEAVHVNVDPQATAALQARWPLWAGDFPLTILESPYRSLLQPLRRYLDEVQARTGVDYINVVIPEFVPNRWWHHILHDQTALLLRWVLLFRKGTLVQSVPYQLEG